MNIEKVENGGSNLPPSQFEGVEERSLLQIALHHRWTIFLTTISFLIVAFIYILKATPLYTSASRLYVEQSGPKVISDFEGIMTRSKNYLYTQAEMLKSTPIVGEVAEDSYIKRFRTFNKVDNVAAYLKKNLNIEVGRKDDIITVMFDSPYPHEAAGVVNSVVDSYIKYHSVRKQTTVSKVLDILQKEKVKRDQELSEKYAEMVDFTRENGVVSFDDQGGNIIFQRLMKLSDALTESQLMTINTRADYEVVKAIADDPVQVKQFAAASPTVAVRVLVNDTATQMESELRAAEIELESVKPYVTEDHPAFKALEMKVEHIKSEIEKEVREYSDAYIEIMRQRWQTAEQKEETLLASFQIQRQMAQNLGVKAAEYSMLESGLKRAERICEILDDRIKELNVAEDTGALNISILEVAHPAESPSKPQKARVMAIALMLGLMFGSGLALIRDWMDVRLRSADEVSAVLGVPVLGSVPAMAKRDSITARGRKVSFEPKSVIAESYRTIRTAIFFGVPKGEAKIILVTSPDAGDGKTTLVSNLAIAMAQAGQKILILDADFRKPMQHNIFGFENSKGLSAVLSGNISIEGAIHKDSVDGLDILSCGPEVPNPSEILNSDTFTRILKDELSKRYDRIIIDSPPVGPVADSQILAAICDITLLVLRAEKSTKKHGQQARDALNSVGGRLLGAVINDVSRRRNGYGYYSNYGYYSSYGYESRGGRRSKKVEEDVYV